MSDMPAMPESEPMGETMAGEGSFDLTGFLEKMGVKNAPEVADALEAWKGGDDGPAKELMKDKPKSNPFDDMKEKESNAIKKGMKENPNPFAKGGGGY